VVHRHVRFEKRERGLDEASYVESFLVLNALPEIAWEISIGCGEDDGLREMLGHEVPSPGGARKFLWKLGRSAANRIATGPLRNHAWRASSSGCPL
jgi:hypothetical protein